MKQKKPTLIIRTRKDKGYFTASNEPFNDANLSFGARGIMGYLLSKPDSWETHYRDLVKRSPDGETKVRGYLKELQQHGYLNRIRVRNKKGRIKWISEIYESPTLNPNFKQRSTTRASTTSGFTTSGFTTSGSTTSGSTTSGKSPCLVNTETEVNTEKVNTEKVNTDGTAADTADPSLSLSLKINSVLQEVSAEMERPIKATGNLAKRLSSRNESALSVKAAWHTCQTNAQKPSGAFMNWVKTGYLPVNVNLPASVNNSATTPPIHHQTPDGILGEILI